MLLCCNCSNNTAIPHPSRKRWSSTRPHSRSRSFLDSISAPSDSSRRCSASFQPPSTRRYRQPRRRRSCSCRCSDRRRSCSRNRSPPIVPLSSLEPRPFGALANLLQKLPLISLNLVAYLCCPEVRYKWTWFCPCQFQVCNLLLFNVYDLSRYHLQNCRNNMKNNSTCSYIPSLGFCIIYLYVYLTFFIN